MATLQRAAVVILIVLLYVLDVVRADLDTTLIYSLCNRNSYNPSDDFGSVCNTALDNVCTDTERYGYDFYATTTHLGTICYAHGACNRALSGGDCTSCLDLARNELSLVCNMRIGGQVQLQDCRIRYENYPFTEWLFSCHLEKSKYWLWTYWIRMLTCVCTDWVCLKYMTYVFKWMG